MIYRRSLKSQLVGGFTLIELLVVIVMVGIISAIAAPSWLAFLTRQQLNAARTDLLGTLRTAQQEAQSLQRSKAVEFSSTDLSVTVKNVSAATGIKTILGNSEVSDKFSLVADSPSLTFKYDGSVDLSAGDSFLIKITDNGSLAQSCVIVTTLLGGLKPASGEACDNFSPI